MKDILEFRKDLDNKKTTSEKLFKEAVKRQINIKKNLILL